MYYDSDTDDLYAPCTGLAVMPSPHSEYAPFYLACVDTFKDFFEEFEALVYDCMRTDHQRAEAIVRYIAPSIDELWRSILFA